MHVTQREHAQAYEAPRHFGMQGYRLQGGDASGFKSQVGLSEFQPGGGAELSAAALDRVYVVTCGELTVTVDDQAHVLRAYDSCFIPAGQPRAIANNGIVVAVVITIISSA
jgi:quercetin dioxygenase-like cupin family protein